MLVQRLMAAEFARERGRWESAAAFYLLAVDHALQDDPGLVFSILEHAARMFTFQRLAN
jgi:hypothetical protein